jgi:capsular polysaccharide biosynthesis protein
LTAGAFGITVWDNPGQRLGLRAPRAKLLDGFKERGSANQDGRGVVELEEAFRRIVGQHLRLIVGFAVVGFAIAAFIHLGVGTSYTATARLVLDTPDPKSRTEAGAIADTGQAIATSPAQVRAALGRVGVLRNSLDVAKNDVTVRPLGTSGVLQLSVRDRNAQVAAAIANSLAAQVIRARLGVSSGKLQQALASIETQLSGLGGRISSLDDQVAVLTAEVANGSTTARSQRDAFIGQRGLLSQQRIALEAERASLLSSDVLRAQPSIISAATVPTHANASGWLPDLMLGMILGLILGTGIAGLLELIRPTLVGGEVLAREFDVPVIGTFNGDPGSPSIVDSMWLNERIRLASEAAGVREVRLVGAGPAADLRSLVASLRDSGPAGAPEPAGRAPAANGSTTTGAARRKGPRQEVSIDVFDLRTWSPNGGGTGLVLVSPISLKKNQLDDINRVLVVSRAPVIGLITYEPGGTLGQRQFGGIVSQAKTWSRTHAQVRSRD